MMEIHTLFPAVRNVNFVFPCPDPSTKIVNEDMVHWYNAGLGGGGASLIKTI